ncbi:hypothetical protein LMG19087_04753 [Ralstonia wenshanensis]|uniref:hypothetical protein n=1 Tax=Ralstonia wenshanensis TaxID=2842456 RepID=UPI0028F51251|nr:hypothetical protein [Ralstonia wenshanensis]CAJ0822310.1 hypothetical protein LMG19087_04753 [Ralstonia wenshanensis]
MRDQAEVARRLETVAGDVLIDYFPLHLPVQLLMVDVIGLEQRPVPASTEFCLRAVEAGLSEPGEICGFLGLETAYGEKLLAALSDNDYLEKDIFDRYHLIKRGSELLRQGMEASPLDRRIYVLWDPIQRVVLDRTWVYTKQRIESDGMIAPISNAFLQPAAGDLEVADINRLRMAATAGSDSELATFEVLRVTAVHRSFGRYRSSLALIFKNQDGELTFRLAINGSIDNELTEACASIGVPKLIGVDKSIVSRSGVQATRKRHRDLLCGSESGKNVAQQLQRRSVLLFNIRSLEVRLAEEVNAALVGKRDAHIAELNKINGELEAFPVVPVRCYEVEYYLVQALKNAEYSITLTTTIPSSEKIDGEILGLLRACLARGVTVRLFVSDRLGVNDATIATIDRLSRDGELNFNFLSNDQRSVFEIEWDGKHLVFSNEPSLGHRRRPITPREFSGFYVTDSAAISRYKSEFLVFSEKDFLVNYRSYIKSNENHARHRKSRDKQK